MMSGHTSSSKGIIPPRQGLQLQKILDGPIMRGKVANSNSPKTSNTPH